MTNRLLKFTHAPFSSRQVTRTPVVTLSPRRPPTCLLANNHHTVTQGSVTGVGTFNHRPFNHLFSTVRIRYQAVRSRVLKRRLPNFVRCRPVIQHLQRNFLTIMRYRRLRVIVNRMNRKILHTVPRILTTMLKDRPYINRHPFNKLRIVRRFSHVIPNRLLHRSQLPSLLYVTTRHHNTLSHHRRHKLCKYHRSNFIRNVYLNSSRSTKKIISVRRRLERRIFLFRRFNTTSSNIRHSNSNHIPKRANRRANVRMNISRVMSSIQQMGANSCISGSFLSVRCFTRDIRRHVRILTYHNPVRHRTTMAMVRNNRYIQSSTNRAPPVTRPLLGLNSNVTNCSKSRHNLHQIRASHR